MKPEKIAEASKQLQIFLVGFISLFEPTSQEFESIVNHTFVKIAEGIAEELGGR